MLDVFAEFESDNIQQRTKSGIEAARKRGRLTISLKIKHHVHLLFETGERVTDIAKEFGIRKSTVYKILKE